MRVTCIASRVGSIARTIDLRGAVEVAPGHHALVASQVPGRITSMTAREGDRVRSGAVLAEIDARQARDTATQVEAALAGANAATQNATVTADRTQRLFDRGIAARQELDDALARLAAAKAQADAAKASLAAASRTVAFATVRAPLEGVVLRTLRATGDLVDGTPATPILEIGDPAALDVLASAVPGDLVRLALDQTGTVRFEALPGRSYDVRVQSIAPSIDPTTGVGAVRLALVLDGGAPPIGLAGEAHVVASAQEGVRTVASASLRAARGGGSEVLVCDAGHLRALAVELGVREGDRVEVTSPLDDAVRIVAKDVLGLADGAQYVEAP